MAMGGTFDHFHLGHESFIRYASDRSQKLLIGIMSDSTIKNKDQNHSLQPYRVRLKQVLNFCRASRIDCQLVELTDPYGPTIDPDFKGIDSLCATSETEAGADKINEIRQAMGLRPLPIFLAPLLNDQTQTPLHSTKIRAGQVNRQGELFVEPLKQGLTITSKQRQFFGKPLGPIVTAPDHRQESLVAVVGDYALSQFLLNGWSYQIGVFDGKTRRQPFVDQELAKITPTLKITNPAGSITAEAFDRLNKLDLSIRQHILVDGEEDLITAALILTLPLAAVLYYGQPNQGMVRLIIDEELKDKVWRLLK